MASSLAPAASARLRSPSDDRRSARQGSSSRIRRYAPHGAHEAAAAGAILVDIRSADTRERDGVIPGSLHVPRTVLEWRVDPASEWRNPALDTARLILVCDHGYSSVLAAATLVELGRDAGDVVGGFEAWAAGRLPSAPGPPTACRAWAGPANFEAAARGTGCASCDSTSASASATASSISCGSTEIG